MTKKEKGIGEKLNSLLDESEKRFRAEIKRYYTGCIDKELGNDYDGGKLYGYGIDKKN